MSQIENQFNSCKPLLDLCKLKKLDLIETMAAGSFIHSVYNGIEKTLVHVFKEINEDLPLFHYSKYGRILQVSNRRRPHAEARRRKGEK